MPELTVKTHEAHLSLFWQRTAPYLSSLLGAVDTVLFMQRQNGSKAA